MAKEVDIVALGELLIDFTEAGYGASGMKLFELLTVASHMGFKTSFIGKVGNDMHGRFLKRTLEQEGIGTDSLIVDDSVFTTLAFVEIDKSGERNFSFARKPGADTQLKAEELNQELLKNCKIFHFGSLSLTDEPAKEATQEAVRIAGDAGAVISYDPNCRASLWPDPAAAVAAMKSMIPKVDVMKVSDEESLLLTGESDYESAADVLLSMGPQLVAITLGADGVLIATKEDKKVVSGYQVDAVDTTGAGDSFRRHLLRPRRRRAAGHRLAGGGASASHGLGEAWGRGAGDANPAVGLFRRNPPAGGGLYQREGIAAVQAAGLFPHPGDYPLVSGRIKKTRCSGKILDMPPGLCYNAQGQGKCLDIRRFPWTRWR